jgi:hypothetical protein
VLLGTTSPTEWLHSTPLHPHQHHSEYILFSNFVVWHPVLLSVLTYSTFTLSNTTFISTYFLFILTPETYHFTFMWLCIVTNFVLNNQLDALVIQIYSVIKLYIFWASSVPIIRSFLLYIQHWQVSCRFDDRFQAESGWNAVPSWLCLEAVIKPAWSVPMANVQ